MRYFFFDNVVQGCSGSLGMILQLSTNVGTGCLSRTVVSIRFSNKTHAGFTIIRDNLFYPLTCSPYVSIDLSYFLLKRLRPCPKPTCTAASCKTGNSNSSSNELRLQSALMQGRGVLSSSPFSFPVLRFWNGPTSQSHSASILPGHLQIDQIVSELDLQPKLRIRSFM